MFNARRSLIKLGLASVAIPLVVSWPARAGQLVPDAFPLDRDPAYQTLDLTSGSYTINTTGINGIPVMKNNVTGQIMAYGTNFDQGGTFDPIVGVLDFNSVYIGQGVTISVVGNDPLALLSRSMTTPMTIDGAISAKGGDASPVSGNIAGGAGVAGGGYGGSGGPYPTGSAGTPGMSGWGPGAGAGASAGTGAGSQSGTGGGYGSPGCNPDDCAITSKTYGDLRVSLLGGSGGGGSAGFGNVASGGGGGAGGGALEFVSSYSITVGNYGSVNVNGGSGGNGWDGALGGGGSGGGLIFAAPTITLGAQAPCCGVEANIEANGTGYGGGGRILFLANQGQAGVNWVNASVSATPYPNDDNILYGAYNAPPCKIECSNTFNVQPNPIPATSFSYVLKGNVQSQIDTTSSKYDQLTNAFAYVNQNVFNDAGSSRVSVSTYLNANGNTVVTFTGPNPILSTYQFNYGNGSTAPHFGIEATSGTPIDVLAQYWTYANSTTSELPNLGFASRLPGAGATRYAVFFANVGFAGGGAPQGVWDEFAFSGATPHVVVTNTTDPTETLSNFGYFISDTELPLDFLNFGNTPPPGYPGSQFIPLSQFDVTLDPGQSLSFGSSVPEPGTWALLLTGFGFMGLPFYRRKRSPADHALE